MLSSYLDSIRHENRKVTIERMSKFLQEKLEEWGDFSIVVRGVSGTVPGSILSHLLDIPLVVVRKEKSIHSLSIVENEFEINKYVIVDDFICTGDTVVNIIQRIKEKNIDAKCIAFIGTDFNKSESCIKSQTILLKEMNLDIPIYYPYYKYES